MPVMLNQPIICVLGIVLCAILASYAAWLYRRNRRLRASLDDTLRKKAEIGNFFTLFAKNLETVEEVEDAMNTTARYLSDLIGANSVCVFILEEDGLLRASGIAGAFPPLHKSPDYVLTKPRYILESLRREKVRIGDGIIGEVAQRQEPLLIEDGSEDPRIIALDSSVSIETLMAVPMIQEGRLFGVLCAVNNRLGPGSFSPEQFSTFRFMSGQIILAYNIVTTYANLSRQQRLSQELDFARQLQASLLPKHFPDWAPFRVHAFARSAKEVSGDFYDFVEIDENRLLVVIGDASGKGIPACMLMAMTRSFIRANVDRFTTFNCLLRGLNKNLFRDAGDGRFVTIALCLLDRRENTVEYARAGHTELLIHLPSHRIRRIYPDGAAVGLMPDEVAGNFDILSFSFLPGMSLLLFTDGITEAANDQGEEYGLNRLSELFAMSLEERNSAQQVIERILHQVDEFSPSEGQADDQTMVIISHQFPFAGTDADDSPDGGKV
jgi:sigma-B regulation protein RsbU (phosphoserine phosphatase)